MKLLSCSNRGKFIHLGKFEGTGGFVNAQVLACSVFKECVLFKVKDTAIHSCFGCDRRVPVPSEKLTDDAILSALSSVPPPNQPPTPATPIVEARPRPTAKQAMTFIEAMILSGRVSDEIYQERLATCEACPMRKYDPVDKVHYCGMCHCKVDREGWKLTNLAAYVEDLPHHGCKFTGRKQGKGGWKR